MKQLSDADIANMIGEDFITDENSVKKSVRQSLHLSTRVPKPIEKTPEHITIDFHNHTEEEAWDMLLNTVTSGARSATVITGASGILKPKFQQWMTNSIISPYIVSFQPLNNGSFEIKIRKQQKEG